MIEFCKLTLYQPVLVKLLFYSLSWTILSYANNKNLGPYSNITISFSCLVALVRPPSSSSHDSFGYPYFGQDFNGNAFNVSPLWRLLSFSDIF